MHGAETRSARIRVPKASELVVAEIRRRIVTGELEPGATLPPEAELIQTLGISRPTLREAYRVLESENLISIGRGARRGAVVCAPDVATVVRYAGTYLQSVQATVADIFQTRLLIEPEAARLFAIKRTADQLAQLERSVQSLPEAVRDPETFAVVAMDLHRQIMDGSGSPTLSMLGHLVRQIWEAHFRRALSTDYDGERVKASFVGGNGLFEAIANRDGEAAGNLMVRQLRSFGQVMNAAGADAVIELMS